MKIEYKDAAAGGGWAALADENAGATFEDFNPQFSMVNQKESLASNGAQASKFLNNQGNVSCQLQLKVNIVYATRDAALASTRTFGPLRTTLLHLRVTQGAEVQYYPAGVCDRHAANVQGLGVTHTFQFETQDVTDTAP